MTVRRRRSRLAALIGLLILLELALQISGPVVRAVMSRERERADPEASLTVLCVGDSNTFGLHLPRVYAYPASLQAALGRRYRRPVNVINRGVPGQNTAQVAAGLEQDLAELSPDLVLILAGINDTWNTDGQNLGLASWLGRLKLVRLARVLLAGVTSASTFEVATDDQGEIVIDRGTGPRRINQGDRPDRPGLTGESLASVVDAGLDRALILCRDAGATPVLMTYAENQGPFREVNELIRHLAAAKHVLLIDHERDFRSHFREQGYESLMFDDHHPNARGYRLMALGADAALARARLVPAEPVSDDAGRHDPASRAEPPAGVSLGLAAGDAGRILLSGPPGWAYQLLMACSGHTIASTDPSGGSAVPLIPDEIMALSRLEPSFSGRFDESGQCLVRIPPALAKAASCPLVACLLLLRDDPRSLLSEDGQSVAAVSRVLTLPRS